VTNRNNSESLSCEFQPVPDQLRSTCHLNNVHGIRALEIGARDKELVMLKDERNAAVVTPIKDCGDSSALK
jgi:hypothetical protein